MVDTSVKYFHSEMVGAPVLSGTPGALIAVLDACLVTGFGLKTVDSLVVAANVATANISSGHPAEVGSVVLISGASPSALNGEQKVTAATTTSVSFATIGITDQTATGTINFIMAPATWNKQYVGSNIAAYKSSDLQATGCVLYMDDTGTTNGRCFGYESMRSISAGTGQFPLASQIPSAGGLYWPKSGTADAKARRWVLASDSRMFYFFVFSSDPYPDAMAAVAFGDIVPAKSGDPFSCILHGSSQDQANVLNQSGLSSLLYSSAAGATCYAPRSYTGLGGASQLKKMFSTFNTSNEGSWSGVVLNAGTPFPNPTDGGVYACPMYLSEATNSALRGVFPGFYCCPQSVTQNALLNNGSITGVTGLAGRLVRTVTGYQPPTGGQVLSFIDNTGPWR